jgi:hypothetical protein
MLRVRFRANPDDYRPVNWPVKHPFWCSGYGGGTFDKLGYAIIVAYADDVAYVKKNWPEATDIDVMDEDASYLFSDRFPKPAWFEEKPMGQPKRTFEEIKAVVDQIVFCPTGDEKNRRTFRLDYVDPTGRDRDHFFVQVVYYEPDIHTGTTEKQNARKWLLSPYMTDTEIVETVFKACRVSMDHVLKESFLYKGRRVYSPHFDIEARIQLCDEDRFDGRIPIGEKQKG